MKQHFQVRRVLSATFAIGMLFALLTGCGGKKQVQAKIPPPPKTRPSIAPPSQVESDEPSVESSEGPDDDTGQSLSIPAGAKALSSETGLASWYGAPYHNRRGSNGEVYNMNAMTAAHRTLPLGSIVRVTNLKTGHAALVRITDRGPFVEGRILDLSRAAAKKLDVWQPGVAQVRVEVMQTPSPVDQGGRWAVQIGAFDEKAAATEVADHLTRRYRTAKVLSFSSPIGDWWVRVRVQNDDRQRAEEIARNTQTSEGSIFLVRLD